MNALVINCSPVKEGATAQIVRIAAECLSAKYEVKTVCIDDLKFGFCKGCRSCHKTAQCFQRDDVYKIMAQFETADVIIAVSPSYWADVPGQFKAFIDRCTPWCNTHDPHAKLSGGKRGYAIALRTGSNMKECERIIQTIKHFYGHLEIDFRGGLGLCSIEYKEAVGDKKAEIIEFCNAI